MEFEVSIMFQVSTPPALENVLPAFRYDGVVETLNDGVIVVLPNALVENTDIPLP
jgi:hypothetical protein